MGEERDGMVWFLVVQNQNTVANNITSATVPEPGECEVICTIDSRTSPSPAKGRPSRAREGDLLRCDSLNNVAYLVDPRMQAVMCFDVGTSGFKSIEPGSRFRKATLKGFGEFLRVRFRD